jgi:FMN phosphatase YigB (HAD superfamily)
VTPARQDRTLDPRLVPAFSAIDHGDIDALSVDVFDTLLLRRVPRPVDAFVLLGQRLVADGRVAPFVTPTLFAGAREQAEERARAKKRHRGAFPEVTLSEIYDELAGPMLIASRDELISSELAVEADLVFADDAVAALVHAARSGGIRVVAVSDTYLSAQELGMLLTTAGVDGIGVEEIFTSSDHRTGKAAGLFEVVATHLGVARDRVLHVGDHAVADAEAATAHGLQALHLPLRSDGFADVLRREGVLPSGDAGTAPTLDAVQGDRGLTAVRARLETAGAPPGLPATLRGQWSVGATVLGPVFTGFGDWVARRASARGVRQVCCLMRESTLLAPLVEQAARRQGIDLEAAPLWLSRRLCARAAIDSCEYHELRIFVERRIAPTVAELAGTLGLAVADLGDLAAYADGRLDDVTLREDVLGRISGEAEIRDKVVTGAATLRKRLVDYVDRCRHPDDDTVVLVDLGWHATAQRCLVRALAMEATPLSVAGLYLVTSERVVGAALDGVDADGFLVRAGEPAAAAFTITRSPEVLEQLCMGPEGSVFDLDAAGEPVLERSAVPRHQQEEAAATRAGILAFADRYAAHVGEGAQPGLSDQCVAQLRAMLTRFVGDPTAREAALFGGWVHDDNFGVSSAATLVRSDLFHDGAYLDETRVGEVDAIWPRAIVARDTEADDVEPGNDGAADARLSIELYVDDGSGFRESHAMVRPIPVNARGLSYIQLGIGTKGAYRIRLDPVTVPAIIRLDRIALRLGVRGQADPVNIVFPSSGELRDWRLQDCSWLAGNVIVATSSDPQLVLDVDPGLAPHVYSVLASVAFAVIELPDTAIGPDGKLLRDLAGRDGILGSVDAALATVDEVWRAVELRLRGRRRGRW